MIPVPARSPDYAKNARRCGTSTPCLICGRPINNESTAHYVHLHGGGGLVVTEEEAEKMDQAADLGCYPVGPECWKRHPELHPYAV